MTGTNESKPISPAALYKIELRSIGNDTAATCNIQSGKCYKTWRYRWIRPENCYPSMMCTKMEGKPCGEYELGMGLEGSEKKEHLCFESQIAKTEAISQGENLEVSLWYLEGAEFDMKCFMWCTHKGSVPEPLEAQAVESSYFDKLVS